MTPTVSFVPSTINGTTNVGVVVKVFEYNGVATSGLITVDPRYALAFNQAATNVSGRAVTNSAWTFAATTSSLFYIMTTNSSILAGKSLAAGFTTTFNPLGARGTTVISATIEDGSGGEQNFTDNNDDETLNHKP